MPKKILITGANGFLGSALSRIALEKKYKVRAFVRENSDLSNLKNLNIEIIRGDLRSKESILNASNGCDSFIHTAADYRLWARKPSEIYESNVFGTENLLDVVSKIKNHRLVFTSSVATLGILKDREANESTPVKFSDMVGDYKKSKYLAEKIVYEYIKNKSLNCLIVNPSTPIGPGDIKPTPTGNIILQMLQKKMPAYVSTGLNFVHVDDVALGHFQAMELGQIGERYILGGENIMLKEFLDLVSEYGNVPRVKFKVLTNPLYPLAILNQSLAFLLNNYKPTLTIESLKMSEKKMFFSSDKAKKKLGYRPRNVKSAIKDAVYWMKGNFFNNNIIN